MDSDYINKYDLLRNHLRVLMHEALKSAPVSNFEPNNSAAVRITNLFLELLERQFPIDSPDNLLKFRTAKDYSDRLAVHTNHLNHAVKEVTGKTTTQNIADRVIKEANALLRNTDWSIGQIATGLGFEEQSNFTIFFKKYTGTTPAAFRMRPV